MKEIENLYNKYLTQNPELAKKLYFIMTKIKTPKNVYLTAGAEFFKKGFLSDALKLFKTANDIESDYLTLYNIGCLYYADQKFKKAIMHLEKAKENNNKFFMAYLVAGLSYSMLSNIRAAESNFITVLMSDPENETALTALSIIYYNRREFDNSLKLIERFNSHEKNSKKMNKLKSNILYETGRLAELVEEIKRRKKISDDYRVYDDYIRSVKVNVFTDKYGTMDDKIKRLNSETGKTKKNLISLSLCHLFSGNTDSAIEYLIQAKELV